MLNGDGNRLSTALLRSSKREPPGTATDPAATNPHTPVVAIPQATTEEIVRCVGDIVGRALARFELIGETTGTRETMESYGLSTAGVRFLPADGEAASCALAAKMARDGATDVLMKGNVHTATFIRAILDHDNRLLEDGQLLSHVAVLDIPVYHKLVLITDAAINVEPTFEEKLAILSNATRTARSLGVLRPKIACVAPVEVPTPRIRSTVDAVEIKRRFDSGELESLLGDVEIDGPFGLDVAVSRAAAEVKRVESSVAGDADILLMPNLDSGNALYKSLTHFAGARVAAVVAGARVPVVLTSRSDGEDDRFYSVLLALLGSGN